MDQRYRAYWNDVLSNAAHTPTGPRHIEYGDFLAGVGRVTEAEFEVIEPTTEQHGNDESAGDGTEPTSGTVWLTSEADGTIFPVDWRDIPYPF